MENFLIGSKNELNSKVHPYLLFQEKTALLERIQSEIKTQTVCLFYFHFNLKKN